MEKGLEAFSADDQERLLRGLANAHLSIGNIRGAEPLVGRLAGLRPLDLSVRFKQFEVACQLDDRAKIGDALQSIEAIEKDWRKGETGGGPVGRLCKARLVIWRANRQGPLSIKRQELEEARLLLAEAGQRIPSWPILSLSQAEIDDLLGDSERALKGYRRALSQGLETSTLMRRVATILYGLGRFHEANEAIREWKDRGLGANDRELGQLEAQVALRVNDRARAIAIAQQSIPASSKDYREHVWLGRILWACGDQIKAEQELRRATELAAGSSDAWASLVEFLAGSGQTAKARSVVEEARTRIKADEALATLGRLYGLIGEAELARQQFRAALSARPADIALLRAAAELTIAAGPVRDAEGYLLRIIERKSVAPEQAAWARRALAVLLASTGDPRQSVKSLDLLGLTDLGVAYRSSANEPIEELRAKATVLALHQNRATKRSAIELLREIIDRGRPNSLAESVTCSMRLYDRQGQLVQGGSKCDAS